MNDVASDIWQALLLGEVLYPLVSEVLYPIVQHLDSIEPASYAKIAKITGMLLEMDQSEAGFIENNYAVRPPPLLQTQCKGH